MDTPPEAAWAEKRRMLKRWGALHVRRSSLGLVATSSGRIDRDGDGKDVLRPRG
jgi:hypothetical protein